MRDVVILVQARLGSTRFPGKILAPFLGMPMLAYQIRQLRKSRYRVRVGVPAGDLSADHFYMERLLLNHQVPCIGSLVRPEDVLGRFARYAEEYLNPGTVIVRACGDCPLLCPFLLYDIVRYWHQESPRKAYLGMGQGWPDGLADYDLFTREALLQIDAEATVPSDREHVIPCAWRHPERFPQAVYPAPHWVRDRQWPKLSVDTPEDLAYVEQVAQHVIRVYGPTYTWSDVLMALRDSPALQRSPEPMNAAYVAQVAQEQGRTGLTWEGMRYHGI
mgnify:CR=1 FL=1